VIADIIRSPSWIGPRAMPLLRRWHGGLGDLLEEERERWLMPWGIASYVLMPFGLEALALKPMGWGISAMLAVARLFSGFPGAAGHFEAMPAAALGVVGGLWFLLWTRRWRWLGVAPVAAGILLTLTVRQPDLLIAEDGKLVAIRMENGAMALSNRAPSRSGCAGQARAISKTIRRRPSRMSRRHSNAVRASACLPSSAIKRRSCRTFAASTTPAIMEGAVGPAAAVPRSSSARSPPTPTAGRRW
jgi:competence protein ComEC